MTPATLVKPSLPTSVPVCPLPVLSAKVVTPGVPVVPGLPRSPSVQLAINPSAAAIPDALNHMRTAVAINASQEAEWISSKPPLVP